MTPVDESSDALPERPRGNGEMGFLEHLEEARKLVLAGMFVLVLAMGCVGAFLAYFADALQYPLREALGEQGQGVALQGLITTGPMGVFSVMLQVCAIGGVVLSLPVQLYLLGRFVAPALSPRELALIKPVCLISFGLFLAGALFSYFVLVPVSLRAAVYFNEMLGLSPIWRADAYYGLLMVMVFGVGVAFEFPLVVVALVRMGVVSVAQLRQFRPYSIVVFLVVAAVITPTADPFTFLLLALPMMGFYEAALWFTRRMENRVG